MPKIGDRIKWTVGLLATVLAISAGLWQAFSYLDNVSDNLGDLSGEEGRVSTGLSSLEGALAITGANDAREHGEVTSSVEGLAVPIAALSDTVDELGKNITGLTPPDGFGLLGEAGIIGIPPGPYTSCNQPYDPKEFVVGVPQSKLGDWPCGTGLTVVNVGASDEEGRLPQVRVRVVDTFRASATEDQFGERIVLLSLEAAQAIGLTLERGITTVYVVKHADPEG